MKFILDKKALNFLEKKKLDKIFINPDLDQKAACCGIGTVDFDISFKDDDNSRYLKTNFENISIFYNPTISMYIKDDQEITLSAFGLGNFKKLYVANEIPIEK
ncbi:hypothetical protein [uncultured Anaerococcus sp.]|uniref:hypothetical protein n=1 Tax=uncultured Anaerococcus sp. TaxID=293428 RepID=UPI00288C27B3|nr:hypothetical protein [uncultured Anaerococcus sp.]